MPKPDDDTKSTAAADAPGQGRNASATSVAGSAGAPAASPVAAQGAATNGSEKTTTAAAGARAETGGAARSDAISLLKQDHRKVEGLFAEFEGADKERKNEIIEEVCRELNIHTLLEERIFYPAVEQADEGKVQESQVEHDAAKVLIVELMEGGSADRYREAKFKVLTEQIKQHVKEEEAADGVFSKAQKAGINTRELGQRLAALKQQLQQKAEAGRLPEPRPASFQYFGDASRQEESMASYRERDDEGRFTSSERGYRSSSRDDDDDRGRSRYASNERNRDERGRFTDDDDRGRSRYASNDRNRDERGRFTDDDRGYRSRSGESRGRGEGGWFGDPEGHSEASRRGWEERGRSEGRSYARNRDYDDDDRGRSYARGHDYDDDGRGRSSRDEGGWFGDSEGHSEASRRGWEQRRGERGSYFRDRNYDEDDRYRSRGSSRDRGQGGWFGDPEGHSEASRRGWEERGGGESRSSYARGRHDDEDDRDGRSRGHGGWSGDPEGHSEASRRGWEHRRH
ncbi:MAG TPA: hemerythrin domain-containing protein [Caulobacteraceae bacterium]|jgi:hypothetical protein